METTEVVEKEVHLEDEIAAKLKERVDSKNLLERKKSSDTSKASFEMREKRSRKRSLEREDSRDRSVLSVSTF